jgi:dihydroorotate dehydrogenase (NAD+) catalytic subunit
VAQVTDVPLIGIGGIGCLDDVMEFLVAGASAVQIGTANYYDPTLTMRLLDDLPVAFRDAGAASIGELVGTLQLPGSAPAVSNTEPETNSLSPPV